MPPRSQPAARIHTVNLEAGMPLVHHALAVLERELNLSRRQGRPLLKLIHGYGSSGVGGAIRIAVQKRLQELERDHAIRGCIFGEDWAASDARTWALLKTHAALKQDPDLGRRNLGITIVLL